MANNPLESADKKYYAAKAPLYLRGTREGRKQPPAAFSYKQKGNDTTASSDKYYASPEQVPTVAQEIRRLQEDLVLRFKIRDSLLQDVVSAFMDEATIVEVVGTGAEISKARAKVDMAVGRGTLTRDQADAITFITTLDEAIVEEQPKAAKPKAAKPKAAKPKAAKRTKKKATRKKTKKAEDIVASALTDKLSDATKGEVLKTGWKDDDDITEKDVAAAFGVSDDDDDSDD